MLLSPGIPWVRIGLLAILILAIGATGFEGGRRWVLADWNAERQEQTATALANAQKDLKLKDRQYEANQTALDAAAASTSKARVAADHARDAAGRLFDDLAAAQRAADDADTSCQSDAEATALRFVAGACVAEYKGVAADAGGLAGQLDALQQWISGQRAAESERQTDQNGQVNP